MKTKILRRMTIWCICFLAVAGMMACSQYSSWQEQYDLGMRYLTESNYEEAILAFTAAIEIDPKRAEVYMSRADAYMGLYETGGEDNLQLAQADYQKALELDDQLVDVYIQLAALYIQQGETEKALDLLRQGYEATGDERLAVSGEEEEPETGTAAFEEQDGYQDFASLSTEVQQAIQGAVTAIQAGDRETVQALLGDITVAAPIYTQANGYKVKVYASPMVVTLEIRPETGQGYAYEFMNLEEGVFETYKSFGCAGWQCNGAWSIEMSHQAAAENANSYRIEASGQAENNQGTAASESTLEWTGDGSVTSEMRMENGVIVYAVVHSEGLGDMDVPDMVGTETEMMTMEWEAW